MFAAGLFLQLGLLFYSGGYIEDRRLKWVYYPMLAVLLIGILFKIMHWPGANVMLLGSITVIFIVTGYNFVNLAQKKLEHYLLISWLSLLTISYYTSGVYGEWKYWMLQLMSVLFWVNVAYAVYVNIKED